MSNSPLVTYTALSPNYNPRTEKITKITPHHMAGVLTVEQCGSVFSSSARQASSNYGIGNDGRVALYVPEDKRSWASSSRSNDQQAVTIEVSNSSTGGDWPVSDKAWNSLVDLCVDICQRNSIPELVYTGDSSGTLTEHRMFTATACPGEYLHSRMQQLADEVNSRLRMEDNMLTDNDIQRIADAVNDYKLGDDKEPKWGPDGQEFRNNYNLWRWTYDQTVKNMNEISSLKESINALIDFKDIDPEKIANNVAQAVKEKLESIRFQID